MAITGAGTILKPYLISTEQDLRDILGKSMSLSAYYKLTADIEMSPTHFPPINNFRGTFDGCGYRISNLVINGTANYVGLFGQVTGVSSASPAQILNLIIENPKITSRNGYTGGLAGSLATNSLAKNVIVVGGSVTQTASVYAGGMFGEVSAGTVENAIVINTSVSGLSSVAGFAGRANSARLTRVLSFPSSVTISSGTAYGISGTTSGDSNRWNQVGTTISPAHNASLVNYRANTMSTNDAKSISAYTSGNNYSWNSSFWSFGEREPWDMVNGSYPKISFYGEAEYNPYKISTEDDLNVIRSNMSKYFKLTNDITFTNTYTSATVIAGDFYGVLDGDGYKFKNINMAITSGDRAFFNNMYGVIKNIGFEFSTINSNSGNVSMICLNNYGIIQRTSGVVTGLFSSGSGSSNSNRGLAGVCRNGAIVENCYVEAFFSGGSTAYVDLVSILANSFNESNTTFRNNIAYIRGLSGERDVYLHSAGTTPSGGISEGNVYYTLNNWRIGSQSGVAKADSLSDFQNGNSPIYNNFNKNIWHFQAGLNPTLKVFIKIVEKIERRLVNSYSKILKSTSIRFKGSTHSVKSFVSEVAGSSNRSISTLRKIVSFTHKNVSNILRTAKAKKEVDSYIEPLKSSSIADLIRKTFRQVTSFTQDVFSRTSTSKKVNKTSSSFAKKFNSKMIKYRSVTLIRKAFSKPFTSNANRIIKMLLRVKSISKKITSTSFSELARKVIREVSSYSVKYISRVRKYTNKFNFARITVNSGISAIVTNVGRNVRTRRLAQSYVSKVSSLAKLLYKLDSPREVMAVVYYKLSQIKLFNRESKTVVHDEKHRTKISMNDGGED